MGSAADPSEDCNFAHGHAELRSQPDLYKTQPCANMLRAGRCAAGSACRYAHRPQELRSAGLEPLADSQLSARHAPQQHDEDVEKRFVEALQRPPAVWSCADPP